MTAGIHFRIPAQRRAPACQPWCVQHIPDDDGGTCMSADLVLPGQTVGLTWQPGDGVRISLHGNAVAEVLTPEDVEHRALAMLAQVAVARAHTQPIRRQVMSR